MKQFLVVLLFVSLKVTGQWTRINGIPPSDIVALLPHNSALYAATDSNLLYKSFDGLTWTGINVSNSPVNITTFSFYNNTLYVGTAGAGIFSSDDDGLTWQRAASGIAPVSSFAIKNSILFAATYGDGVYALNTATNQWSPFNEALPGYSVNVQNIIGSPDFLLIGAGSNGTFYRYNFNSNEWNEEYYFGLLRPGLQINKLINRADTVWAVNGDKIIRSNDAGFNWSEDKAGTHNGADRVIYAGQDNYYTLTNLAPQGTWIQQRNKNAGVGKSWASGEEFFTTGYAYTIAEFNNKLFLGKSDGLYGKSLNTIALPVNFVLFNGKCDGDKVEITWKTSQEQNSSYFDLERSTDGLSWRVIGDLSAAGNSAGERSYSFTDKNPVQDAYYRIAEYDLDGKVQYSSVLRTYCSLADFFTIWPNPVHDAATVRIVAGKESTALIKLFNSKGQLVKLKKERVFQGANQLMIDLKADPPGLYLLLVEYEDGHFKKMANVIKQ